MATLSVPQDLLDRLKAAPRTFRDTGPLTADEREMLALRLEWLAAEVRETTVHEASWGQDREMLEDDDPFSTSLIAARVPGPWKHTVEIQLGFPR